MQVQCTPKNIHLAHSRKRKSHLGSQEHLCFALVHVQIQIAEGKAEKQETFKLMLTLKRTPRLLFGMVRVVGLEMEMEMVWGGLLPFKPPQFCRHSLAGVIVWPLEGNRPGRQRVLCEAL